MPFVSNVLTGGALSGYQGHNAQSLGSRLTETDFCGCESV
jgi:hypothetical protein